MTILGHRVKPLLKKTWSEIGDDNIGGLAAEAAYNFFFSIFPILLVLIPMLGLVGDKETTFQQIMSFLSGAVPPDAYRLLYNIAHDVVFAENAPGLVSIGAVLALWSGSNVFSTLMGALNRAYDVKDARPWWKQKLIAITAVFVLGGAMLLNTIILVAGEQITTWLAGIFGLSAATQQMIVVLQTTLALVLLVGIACLSYFYLPNVRQHWAHVLAAAIVTTFLWIVATFALKFYVGHFANYNKTYGTIGGVMLLLTWMYYSMFAFLAGGEIASELQRGTGAVSIRRGVLYGDRVVTGAAAARPSTDQIERVEPLRARGA
jgi:membrane protein